MRVKSAVVSVGSILPSQSERVGVWPVVAATAAAADGDDVVAVAIVADGEFLPGDDSAPDSW